jgi:hypothetical protein
MQYAIVKSGPLRGTWCCKDSYQVSNESGELEYSLACGYLRLAGQTPGLWDNQQSCIKSPKLNFSVMENNTDVPNLFTSLVIMDKNTGG